MLSSIYVTNSIEKLNSYDKKTVMFEKNCALQNNNDDYCQAELSFVEKEIVKIKVFLDTSELLHKMTFFWLWYMLLLNIIFLQKHAL